MSNWEFQTEGFRDPVEVRAENLNEIEGAGLAEAVRAHLLQAGFVCDEVFPEDFGWVFYATGTEGRYFLTFSIDPLNDEDRETARQMYGHVGVTKGRRLWERLLGLNREMTGEAVPQVVDAYLRGHPDLHDLVAHGR